MSNENKNAREQVQQRQPVRIQIGGGPMMGMGGGGKPKSFKVSMGKLIRYCKKFIVPIVIALLLAVLSAIPSILGPSKIGDMTDIIQEGLKSSSHVIDLTAVAEIATLTLILYLSAFLIASLQGFVMTTITQWIAKSLRTDISKKINRLPLKYYDNTTFGNVLSRVTNDVDSIAQALNQSVAGIVTAITMFIGVMIMMFITNWIMAITAICASFIGFFLVTFIIKRSQKFFASQQKSLGLLNGHIEETYSGHNVVKVYNAGEKAKRTFAEINGELYKSAWKSQFMSGLMMPLMGFVGNLGFVSVCIVGGALAINGSIGLGVIASFILYARLFSQPLTQIAQGMTSLQSAAAASERVFEFLEAEEMINENGKEKTLKNVRGNVDFEKIVFGYVPEKTVINNFSAHAKAGEKIAIVGPTGAGKTTLVNLLMRFYELNSGKILIDGVDIAEIKRKNLRELFGMVLQDTWLFEGTIRENIAYSKINATDSEIEAAAKAAGIDHFIRTLPNSYNTVLDDKASLSSGQRQLLTIARAMVENAPMLILDEATSNVDTRTEILIQEAMDKLTKGRTSFVIAHRLSTIRNADLILVMKDGDIVESGNHSALMAKNGFYAELYNSQFEDLAA